MWWGFTTASAEASADPRAVAGPPHKANAPQGKGWIIPANCGTKGAQHPLPPVAIRA